MIQLLTAIFLTGLSLQTLANTHITHILFTQASPGSVDLGAGRRLDESPYKFIDTVSSIENEKVSDLGVHLVPSGC